MQREVTRQCHELKQKNMTNELLDLVPESLNSRTFIVLQNEFFIESKYAFIHVGKVRREATLLNPARKNMMEEGSTHEYLHA